jgi:hypothetical protein
MFYDDPVGADDTCDEWTDNKDWKKESKADMNGAMVALFIPTDIAKKLKIPDGEPISNMHITLAYFEDAANDRDDWDIVKGILQGMDIKPLTGKVIGYGTFETKEGQVL